MLIVNTLPQEEAVAAIAALKEKAPQDCEIINTEKMDIRPCIGCNFCWLKTPGICSVKDDYETVIKAYLRHETVVFIGNTAFCASAFCGKYPGSNAGISRTAYSENTVRNADFIHFTGRISRGGLASLRREIS